MQRIDTASVAGMQTTRDAFKSALHKEYVSLAKAEQKDDADDTKYFIKKARDAGLALDVLPQQLNERKIPAHASGQLAKARMALVNKLWNGGSDLTSGPRRALRLCSTAGSRTKKAIRSNTYALVVRLSSCSF